MYNARITKLGFVFLVIFLPFIKAQDDLKYGDTIYIQSMAKEHVWMKEDLYLPPHKIGTLVDYQLKKMVGNALVDIEKNPADELGYQFIFTGKTGCLKYGDKVQVRSNVENPDTGGTIVGASGMVGNRSFKRHHHTLILRSEEGNGDPDQKDSRSTECIKEKSSVFLQITQKKNWLRYNPDWYHMVVKNCLTCDTTERKKDVGEFLWKLRLDMGSGDRFPKLNWKGYDPSGKLGQCEGDCEDGDCKTGLVCVHDQDYVPGCSGKVKKKQTDYCTSEVAVKAGIHAPLELEWKGYDPSEKLGQCMGDCDDDDDCKPGLVCHHDKTVVPGCVGKVTIAETDYCAPLQGLRG